VCMCVRVHVRAYACACACACGTRAQHSPFAVFISEDGKELYSFNGRGYLMIEHQREKQDLVQPAPPADRVTCMQAQRE
jgi:hypothetical protein